MMIQICATWYFRKVVHSDDPVRTPWLALQRTWRTSRNRVGIVVAVLTEPTELATEEVIIIASTGTEWTGTERAGLG